MEKNSLDGFEPMIWGYNIRFYRGEECIFTKMLSEKEFRKEFRRHAPAKVVQKKNRRSQTQKEKEKFGRVN